MPVINIKYMLELFIVVRKTIFQKTVLIQTLYLFHALLTMEYNLLLAIKTICMLEIKIIMNGLRGQNYVNKIVRLELLMQKRLL